MGFRKPSPEKNSLKVKVSTNGFVPARDRISSVLRTGIAMDAYRRGYDFGSPIEVPDDWDDPTRRSGYDTLDGLMDAVRVKALIAKRNDDLKRADLVSRARASQEAAVAAAKALAASGSEKAEMASPEVSSAD